MEEFIFHEEVIPVVFAFGGDMFYPAEQKGFDDKVSGYSEE